MLFLLAIGWIAASGASAAQPKPAKPGQNTPTPTPTASSSPVSQPSATPTATATRIASATPSRTPTASVTATSTAQASATAAVTATATATATATVSATATPTSGGAVGLGIYRPEFPNNLAVATTLEQASGRTLAIVSWYSLWGGWKSGFSASDLQLVASHGSLPLITWEPWAGVSSDPAWSLKTAILSGANDAYIQSWASGMASYGKPVLLRFAHEMHSSSYPWAVGVNGNTAADYLAAWKHVHDIFVRAGATNVKWVWNPNTMGDTLAGSYAPIYQSLYPGDAYVDFLGLDIFNTGPNLNWGAPYWRSFSQVLNQPYQAITSLSGKPLLLPEVGCPESGGSKPTWITDAMQSQLPSAFPRVKAFVWFDVQKEEDWQLDSSSSALSAWQTGSRLATYNLTGSGLL